MNISFNQRNWLELLPHIAYVLNATFKNNMSGMSAMMAEMVAFRDRGSSRGLLDRDLVASQVSYHSGIYISRGAQYQQALAALLVPLLQSD